MNWLVKTFPVRLFGLLLFVGFSVIGISTWILYDTSINSEIETLKALSRSHAKLINAVTEFDAKYNSGFADGGSRGATLLQIHNTHFEKLKFGETGEIVIGEIKDDKIHFITPSRLLGGVIPQVDLNTSMAGPMRRALHDHAGSMTALDYQGHTVMAWHEPLPDLNAGLVAKIDVSEIYAPFKNAILLGCATAFIMTILCCLLYNMIATWCTHRDEAWDKTALLPRRAIILLALTLCLTFVGTSSVATLMGYLYQPELEKQKDKLWGLSIGMSSLIGAVADFDVMTSGGDSSSNPKEATIAQIKQAMEAYLGFGKTGEIVVGQLNGGMIEILSKSQVSNAVPDAIELQAKSAAPMQLALSGKTGEIVGLDYRNVKVVAAYQPVSQLDLGLVAKMDLEELRQPFFLIGVINISLTFFIIVLAVLLAPQILKEFNQFSVSRQAIEISTVSRSGKDVSSRVYVAVLLVMFAGMIFLLDYMTPLGIAAGIPYIALLIMSAFFLQKKGILILALLATILTLIGWSIAPAEGAVLWNVLTNRLYALFTIWLAAIILLRNKKAEKQLSNRERRLAFALEGGKLGSWDYNVITGENIVDDRWAEMLGYKLSEIEDDINGFWEASIHPDDLDRVLQSMEDYILGKAPEYDEIYRARTKSGEYIWVQTKGSISSVDENGKVITCVGIVIDVNDLVESQQHLKLALSEAKAATEAKASFLANMSHEIRTPMNGVIGMVDLLRQTELKDDQKQMLQTVNDSGQSLLTIINDILDFSKIEAGKLDLENIPLSLSDVVEGSAQTQSANTNNKGLRLITYIDPELPQFVIGDPVRLRQILINLSSNAIKFTEQGDIVIRVERIENDEADMITVRLSVIDQGIGISDEAQNNLFQAFSQAESSTTRQYGGTGLGLTISKNLVEMMGGEIGVTSKLGEGSEFFAILTFRQSDKKGQEEEEAHFEGLRVLLISSHTVEAAILRHYLEYWDAEVTSVDELNRCFELCKTAKDEGKPYDIVIIAPQWTREEQFEMRDKVDAQPALSDTRFICLLKGKRRRERLGLPDSVCLDVDPLRRSAFLTAVAVAVGRASPEVYYEEEVEDLKATDKALTVGEALVKGTLILMAEDNPTNRDVIGRQLNLLGYACEMAEDGALALEAWRNKNYGILLTDCHMPNMDGFELTEAIRNDEKDSGTRVPIVAITANALQGEAERCLAAGMDDYLSKPIDMKDLRQTLIKWMPQASKTDVKAEEISVQSNPTAKLSCPIDVSVLTEMFGNDPEMIKEILNDFIQPSQDIIEDMKLAHQERSAEGVKQAAHKLKSSAGSVGANKLADLCEKLEQAGKEENWNSINAGMPDLDPLFNDAEHYITNL
jgi:PAS domain S-box-containing protein